MTLQNHEKQALVDAALGVRQRAYAPYSNYAVGAALLSSSGQIFTGANVENAAYPTSMCAERSAVFKAVSEGEQSFTAIAVATSNGGMPCGSCRQVLSEFSTDILVILADEQGRILQEIRLGDLLPFSFGPQDLD